MSGGATAITATYEFTDMDPGFTSHSKENFTHYHCIIFFSASDYIYLIPQKCRNV